MPAKAASYGVPVLAVLSVEALSEEPQAMDDFTALGDDAYWARFVRGPFSWSRFMTWWVARRWVIPRDITKE